MDKQHLKTSRSLLNLKQGRRDWYSIKNQSADTAEVYIYDEIGYFGITASDFVKDLQNVSARSIELHLNTPGGEVFDGIAIYNALKMHDAEVTVIVDSLAASIGSVIAQAGDKVVMQKNASMMIHDAHGLAIGNSEDMRTLAELLDKTSDNIASIYAERSGTSADDWRSAMKAETWYSADEAVKAGLADEVGGDGSDSKNSWDLSVFNYAGRNKAPEPVIPDRVETPQLDISSFRDMMREALA